MDPSLTRGTTPTVRNPGIDFVNFRHPVPKTDAFGGTSAWTENRYKLIRFGESEPELYDLISDPSEARDIASDHPERVRSMLQRLEEWQRSVEISLAGRDY